MSVSSRPRAASPSRSRGARRRPAVEEQRPVRGVDDVGRRSRSRSGGSRGRAARAPAGALDAGACGHDRRAPRHRGLAIQVARPPRSRPTGASSPSRVPARARRRSTRGSCSRGARSGFDAAEALGEREELRAGASAIAASRPRARTTTSRRSRASGAPRARGWGARQAGVDHARHLGWLSSKPRRASRSRSDGPCARQRLRAAQHEEASIGPGAAPTAFWRKRALADASSFVTTAADDVGVAAEVLRDECSDEVGAERERPLQVGRRERVVDDDAARRGVRRATAARSVS